MVTTKESFTIEGEEKNRYLGQLDLSLDVLAKSLNAEKDPVTSEAVVNFSRANKWDVNRLPNNPETYKNLASLVNRVRREYQWFDWKTFSDDPGRNYGYFESLDVSTDSGLPWVFDFVELHRLKREAEDMLEKVLDYDANVRALRSLLLEDTIELDNLKTDAQKLYKAAMKRSFLEQVNSAELLGWEASGYSLAPVAQKVVSLGGEELWDIYFIRYSPSTSRFHMYLVNLWQDNKDKQIVEKNGDVIISKQLLDTFKFGEENVAWYMLTTVDKMFESLHPVHLSRAILGPFENKYIVKNNGLLDVTKEILKEDPDFGLLRLSVQYSYAPNHETRDGKVRQIIYQDDWRDEILVVPAKYSGRVNSSVLGARVRVLEV